MFEVKAQASQFNEALLSNTSQFTELTVENTRKLVSFQLDSAREAYSSAAEHLKALTAVRDAKEFSAIGSRFFESTLERAAAYSQGFYDLASAAQSQVGEAFETQSAALYQQVAQSAENVAKSLPVGSEAAVAAVKSSVAATAAAVDTIKSSAKESAAIAAAAVKKATTARRKAS